MHGIGIVDKKERKFAWQTRGVCNENHTACGRIKQTEARERSARDVTDRGLVHLVEIDGTDRERERRVGWMSMEREEKEARTNLTGQTICSSPHPSEKWTGKCGLTLLSGFGISKFVFMFSLGHNCTMCHQSPCVNFHWVINDLLIF